jgi:hypothetical protein
MSKRSFSPTDDTDNLTVYVGAYVPYWLCRLLVEEAEQAGLSRSRMIGRALAERYEQKGTKEQEA